MTSIDWRARFAPTYRQPDLIIGADRVWLQDHEGRKYLGDRWDCR